MTYYTMPSRQPNSSKLCALMSSLHLYRGKSMNISKLWWFPAKLFATHTQEVWRIIWRVLTSYDDASLLSNNIKIRDKLSPQLPMYHSRAMKRKFVQTFGFVNVNQLSSGRQPLLRPSRVNLVEYHYLRTQQYQVIL